MNSTDLSKLNTAVKSDERSSTLNLNMNMMNDASHLNLVHSMQHHSKSTNDHKMSTKRSNLLGITRKKYNFFNTSSSKVVPIDCLDNDSLEFAKESIKLNGDFSSSFIDNSEKDAPSDDVDTLPTIRILNDKENNHIRASVDKHVQVVDQTDANLTLLCTKPFHNERSQKLEVKRKKEGNYQYISFL